VAVADTAVDRAPFGDCKVGVAAPNLVGPVAVRSLEAVAAGPAVVVGAAVADHPAPVAGAHSCWGSDAWAADATATMNSVWALCPESVGPVVGATTVAVAVADPAEAVAGPVVDRAAVVVVAGRADPVACTAGAVDLAESFVACHPVHGSDRTGPPWPDRGGTEDIVGAGAALAAHVADGACTSADAAVVLRPCSDRAVAHHDGHGRACRAGRRPAVGYPHTDATSSCWPRYFAVAVRRHSEAARLAVGRVRQRRCH
jgi:hypothetical protein